MDKNNENAKNVLILFGVPVFFAMTILALIPVGLFSAWVSQKLYGWFLLPVGAPHLNLWHVWGIILLINFLKPSNNTNKEHPWKDLIRSILITVIVGLTMLVIGSIIKDWI